MEMTQEEMKHNILDFATDVSVAVESFSRDIKFEMKKSTVEADLQEAKLSAKKLTEKIDEYLESQKPKFKVGDYIVEDGKGYIHGKAISLIERHVGSIFLGPYYLTGSNKFIDIGQDDGSEIDVDCARHATPEEIAEYESALTFHKHGRKPFELKRGDVVYLKGYDKNIFLDSGNIYKKHNFVDGDVALIKTAEEIDEWLGADDDK